MRRLVLAGLVLSSPAAAQDFRAAAAGATVPPYVAAAQPELAAAMARQAKVRVEAAMSAAALDAVAREPWRAAEILRAAEAAAPEAYPAVASAVAAAFPALASVDAPPASAAPTMGAAPPPNPSTGRVLAELLSTIAADPSRVEEAVGRAVAAAPAERDFLLREASLAFPGFADRIGGVRPASSAVSGPQGARAASAPEPTAARRPAEAEAIVDPLEGLNRAVLGFNDVVDQALLRPVAWTYNKLMPDPAILAVRRFFANLRAPVLFANDVLQLEFADAATTAGRFGLNSTIGLLGLFEVAEPLGLPAHHADFGQTMHSYGSGPGPYLMLPLLGPSTLRDGTGRVVDVALDPLTWLLTPGQSLAVTGTQAVVRREELLEPLDELRESSVDWYAALRSAYYQRRAVELGKLAGAPPVGAASPASDDLFDELEAEGAMDEAATQ
jgi:phospholipid-binding lipoprotein MlaA